MTTDYIQVRREDAMAFVEFFTWLFSNAETKGDDGRQYEEADVSVIVSSDGRERLDRLSTALSAEPDIFAENAKNPALSQPEQEPAVNWGCVMSAVKVSIFAVVFSVFVFNMWPRESVAGGNVNAEKLGQASNAVTIFIRKATAYEELSLGTDNLIKTWSPIRNQGYSLLGPGCDFSELKTRNSNGVDFGQLAFFSGAKLTNQFARIRDRLAVIRQNELTREGFSVGDATVLNARDRNARPVSGNEIAPGLAECQNYKYNSDKREQSTPTIRQHRAEAPDGTITLGITGLLLSLSCIPLSAVFWRCATNPKPSANGDTSVLDTFGGIFFGLLGIFGLASMIAAAIVRYGPYIG